MSRVDQLQGDALPPSSSEISRMKRRLDTSTWGAPGPILQAVHHVVHRIDEADDLAVDVGDLLPPPSGGCRARGYFIWALATPCSATFWFSS